ncbi:hypothetical protein ACHAW5_005258 [Stephanodiscus triporus]|uniref:Uncharacterized protein n=1 Tax=Stephanodiscus triporus TaxID=2934178 RepID=A0ABD3MUB6_9STRA
MSFDREGILLATGDDNGRVRVYDFDDVRAADAGGRNVDRLVIYFTNRRELRVYDVASGDMPPPFVRLGDDDTRSRPEGTTRALFMPTTPAPGRRVPAAATRIIAGGDRGTVRMWTIPTTFGTGRLRTAGRTSSSVGGQVSPRCAWSFEAFRTEGVCDMLTLGSNDEDDDGRVGRPTMTTTTTTSSSHPSTKSLVLLAGDGSSLVLLDADRCTRKAFSTTITPTVVASWDLHLLMSRELSKVDVEAILPARRWTAVHGLHLLRRECTDRHTSFEVGIVARCGWMLVAEFRVPRVVYAAAAGPVDANPTQSSDPSVSLRLSILHLTPRIRCFNSSNEPLTTLGGMALQFSLPEISVPSAALRQGAIWLGDVKQMGYTMPSKDKYVLSEEHGILSSPNRSASSPGMFRHPGGGLILACFDGRSSSFPYGGEKRMCEDVCIHARLPLSGGSPLTLAAHPSGEWIVIGYGMNGRRGAATKQIELASLGKMPAWR